MNAAWGPNAGGVRSIAEDGHGDGMTMAGNTA